MQGYNVLFQPGYDHAGISTQSAVEKHLATEGKTRQDLGREAFVELVWEWLREYGGKIMFQFRRIGASLDYRRERFTMDDAYVRVRDAVLRPRLGQGLDLPREPDHQLVPVPPHVAVGSRARASRGRRRAHVRALPVRRRRRPRDDRDGAARDDPGRRRRRGASGRRALPRGRRPRGGRALGRAARARHRRRAGGDRLRHRSAQDHPRPRSARLRDRPRPRSARADRDRPGRPHERRGGRARRASRRKRPRSGSSPGCANATSSRSGSRTATASRSATGARAGSSRGSRRSGSARWTS